LLADHRNDRSFAALAGYRWAVGNALTLGIEGGYGDLGKATEHSYSAYVSTDVDGGQHSSTYREQRAYKAKAYLLGVNGQWNLDDRWNLSARYGLARYRTHFTIKSTGTFDDLGITDSVDIKDRHDGRYFGAAVGYKASQHVNVSLALDHYKPSYRDVPGGTAAYALYVWNVRAEYLF
jgi:OmpA-OmpF porin, OOP family